MGVCTGRGAGAWYSRDMLRWLRALAPLAAAAVWLTTTPAHAEPRKLRFATLAPKNSSWGKVFKVWAKAVTKKTDGKLELDIFYNAVQGGEESMVTKMKSGQLDGAALTSVGLSRIYRDALVLQLPGVVDSWELLDKVRAAVGPDIEAGMAAEGFRLLGWGDVGLVHLMSRGFAVRVPQDLRGKSPAVWRDEPIGPQVFAAIGGVVAVPVTPVELLPALRSGKVNVVSAPALAAEQLQWVPQLDHVGANVSVCAVGGSVIRQQALDDLPGDLRDAFLQLQEKMSAKSAGRIRKLDADAYERARKKMTVVELSDAEREEWRKVLKPVIEQLAEGTFKRELVKKVVELSGKS